jgi:hypothetical protein
MLTRTLELRRPHNAAADDHARSDCVIHHLFGNQESQSHIVMSALSYIHLTSCPCALPRSAVPIPQNHGSVQKHYKDVRLLAFWVVLQAVFYYLQEHAHSS